MFTFDGWGTKSDFHIDRFKRHFLLNKEDQIAHIIYIFANEEIIDGELSFYVTRMFAYNEFENGAYDNDLAKKRYARIKSYPEDRIQDFIRILGGNYKFFSKNMRQFSLSLNIDK